MILLDNNFFLFIKQKYKNETNEYPHLKYFRSKIKELIKSQIKQLKKNYTIEVLLCPPFLSFLLTKY